MMYEHVAFDLDGTLVDSRGDLAAAVDHVLRSFGLPEMDPSMLYGYTGDGARALVERALGAERQALFQPGVDAFMAY
jgi:phosphoglycolate phosphatase